ncbi:RPA34 [[Candida] subhashii]|uniref:RPA34 n=1 Tax=[Candida] subhashii TaxID=561895 RepID=A0A8J5QDB8_9ASCO|nr:RPA34 [[Candida] subhashii]KAG7664079.1 RPA34 [[Candida] subhashii]
MAPKVYKSSEYVQDSDVSSDEEDQEFKAPKHYHKLENKSKLDIKNLKEKEIWLIKAPKGFPLKDLKTLPVSFTATSIKSGPDSFKVDGNSYKVDEEFLSSTATGDDDSGKHTIFFKHSKAFKSSGQHISRVYNIRETVKIPKINFDQVVIPREDVPKIDNLRMRHFPTGYGANDFKVEDEAGDEDVAEGKVLKKVKVDESSSGKEKKHKKDKKEKKEKKKSKKDKS